MQHDTSVDDDNYFSTSTEYIFVVEEHANTNAAIASKARVPKQLKSPGL